MRTEQITVDREEARALYRKYREHQHYSTPIDLEIQRTYAALGQGKVVIRAIASIAQAGLNKDGLPKLAIVRAADDADQPIETCHLYLTRDGGARFSTTAWPKDRNWRTYVDMPAGSFPDAKRTNLHFGAQVPLVPIHLRPKRALASYHILFEAEWQPIPPKDPLLLRRIGRSDLWVVCAAWDLTEIERAVLAGHIR
jgi:hypothetical protein